MGFPAARFGMALPDRALQRRQAGFGGAGEDRGQIVHQPRIAGVARMQGGQVEQRNAGGGRPGLRQPLLQQCRQRSLGIGLAQIIVRSGGEADFAKIGVGIGGQRDDGNMADVGRQPADLPGGVQAVHFRHLPVHQHQIERLLLQHVQRLRSAGGNGILQAHFAQLVRQHFLVHRMVFHDQDASLQLDGGLLRRQLNQRQRRCRQAQRQGEAAARAGFALDRELTAHQFSELAADSKPQAGAAVTPRGRRVGL